MSSSLSHSRQGWLVPDLLDAERNGAGPVQTASSASTEAAWCLELDQTMLVPALSGRADWLRPIIRHMGSSRLPIVIATTAPQPGGADKLTGRFAFEKVNFRWAAPMPVLLDWQNPLFLSGAPMVLARDGAGSAFASMVQAAGEQGARAVILKEVTLNDDMIAALESSGVAWCATDTAERAALVCGQPYDEWFSNNFSRKRRKEYRRLHNRLSETGTLVSHRFEQGEDAQPWISDFLELESSGWKGDRGTAMACDQKQRSAVTDALLGLARSGDLLFWKLSLDERPIAMLFAIKCGHSAGLGKIAFDERLSAYSPGVLLILEATRDLLSTPGITMVDSHAIPDHPMINNIWRDRVPIADLMLATPGTPKGLFTLMRHAEEKRQELRQLAKTMYHRHLKRGTK
ncbi:MAG: GNAT family N-acetyltransferase [Pseudomonadota bacterium]